MKLFFSLLISAILCIGHLPSVTLANTIEKGQGSSAHSKSDAPLMTLKELRKLMKQKKHVRGYFKTVIDGMKIERFDFTVQEITSFSSPDLEWVILITLKQPIAGGMSGSPAYIDGKLVGAVGYRFNLSLKAPYFGGIQPIEMMARESKNTPSATLTRTASPIVFTHNAMPFEYIPLGNESIKDWEIQSKEINTHSVSLDLLKNQQLIIASGANSIRNQFPMNRHALKPGMPIVVELASWKDESGRTGSIGALGTITYVNAGRIYAFGHPFLSARNTHYPFRTATIAATVNSLSGNYKILGQTSETLGMIYYDGTHGIYGKFFQDSEQRCLQNRTLLKNFTLEFQKEGSHMNQFTISVADSPGLTPLLALFILKRLGAEGAPLPEQPSITELHVWIPVTGHREIVASRSFSNVQASFGFSLLHMSSYEVAMRNFLLNVYKTLLVSNFRFGVGTTRLVANFILKKPQKFIVAWHGFPSKIAFGENPTLNVVLLNRDNTIVLTKQILIQIEWNKVRLPLYAIDTPENEKNTAKKVLGKLYLYSHHAYESRLSPEESQILQPEYYLGPEDFLSVFERRLQVTENRLFGKLEIASRRQEQASHDQQTSMISGNEIKKSTNNGWRVFKGRLTRRVMKKKQGKYNIRIVFPPLPAGSLMSSVDEVVQFEIVAPKNKN